MTTDENEVQRWVAATNAALARNAVLLAEPTTPQRLAALMRQYGTGRTPAAKLEPALGQAKPWGEVLKALGYAKPAGSPSGATIELRKSTTRTASSPARPEPATEQTAPAARALPWAEIIAEVEAEGRPAR